MNFVRRIVNSKTDSGNTKPILSEDKNESLNQLRSQYLDYKSRCNGLSISEQDDLLYSIIPLFYKLFCSTAPTELCERFPEVFPFCSLVSSLMVREIKIRATNQKTEEASLAISQYLQPSLTQNSNVDESKGWVLLNTLNVLSRGPASLIDCMISVSLPSTFVKCLYIFFDLPNPETNCSHSNDSMFSLGNKSSKVVDPLAIHRRNILLDNFRQVLQRICIYPATTEELVRKEDLRLLFGAVASWCPIYNSGWRKAAADVLQTIAHNGLTQTTIQHIYHKKLISQCLKNVTKGGLRSIEIVDIFVTLFHLLRESSDISQMLLDDFRNSQGYAIIEEFLIKLEKEISNETEQDSIRSLIILIAKLTTCGYVELRPKQNVVQDVIYAIEGFELPMPLSKNESIRNFYSFNVLQSVFLHAETDFLCLRILEAIKTIYQQDPANYFILEPQNTFQMFSEKIFKKSPAVQEEFFGLIDCVVRSLNYVPVKEISSSTVIMKSCNITVTISLLVKSFIRLLEYHKIFKDVLRDLGVLELCVKQLHGYACVLQNQNKTDCSEDPSKQQDELGLLTIHFLTLFVSGVPGNVDLFRKVGGIDCVYSLVNFETCQKQALELVKVLTLSSGSEEDMKSFMRLLPSSAPHNLVLKIKIIQVLLSVLKESHRCRVIFRKVHSFVLMIQELVALEGCFSIPSKPPWDSVPKVDLVEYIKQILSVLTMALRKEPGNVRYFIMNVTYASLTEAVRNLGCFGSDVDLVSQDIDVDNQPISYNNTTIVQSHSSKETVAEDSVMKELFEELFLFGDYKSISDKGSPESQQALLCCFLLKFIYDNAIEHIDNILPSNYKLESKKVSLPSPSIVSPSSETASPISTIPIVIHPEAIISMLHLIPALHSDHIPINIQLSLQMFILEKMHSLFDNDRNLHQMCDSVSMPQELLTCFRLAMVREEHPLNSITLVLFERLASQKVTPKNVRDFLRLADPLCCQNLVINKEAVTSDHLRKVYYESGNITSLECCDQNYVDPQQKNGGPICLTRIKSLIGMTSHQNHSDRVCIPIINDASGDTDYSEMRSTQVPSFVEMNMCHEGFSCLFLPSVSPQNLPSNMSAVGLVSPIENNVMGGIGIGERVFPPTGGFSFSTWICVQKFSSTTYPHPVRLLSLVRSVQGSNDFIQCLSISITNSPHHTILVSTKERIFNNKDQDSGNDEFGVEFPCEALLRERCWSHVILTFHRSGMLKHSCCTFFLNGQLIDTKKLNYISPNVSSNLGNMGSLITSIHAFVGTPPVLQKISSLCWRQGPLHLIEEPLSSQIVSLITRLGPNFVGNFQNALLDYEQPLGALIAEEKMVFSLYANNTSIFTLPRISKIYNVMDASVIARQLHLHPKEKSSPIRIIHNAACHLSGASRSFGAVLIGHDGIRSFSPAAMSKMLDCVGGTKVLLGILAMAFDAEGLYAVVKSVCSILNDNRSLLKEMEHNHGYKLMDFILKKKRHLLSSRIFSLLVGLAGSSDQEFQEVQMEKGKQQIINISTLNKFLNKRLFEEVICDFDLWLHCNNVDSKNNQLLANVLKHICEFFQRCVDMKVSEESPDKDAKVRSQRSLTLISFLNQLRLMDKLINLMMHFSVYPINHTIMDPFSRLLELILVNTTKTDDLRKFGQFMVWTLSALGTSETEINVNDSNAKQDQSTVEFRNISNLIEIRNMCFRVILKVLNSATSVESVEPRFAEDLVKCLGFDWLLLFMQCDIHPSTIIVALRVLCSLLSIPSYIAKFRDGILCSGWLTGTDVVLQKRHGLLLMDNALDQPAALREINLDSCHMPGFVCLESLLPHHCRTPDVYFMLIALLLGNKIKNIPDNLKFEFESVCNFLFGHATDQNPVTGCKSGSTQQSGWSGKPISGLLNRLDSQNNISKKNNVTKKNVEMCPEAATILLTMMRVMLNQNCFDCENDSHIWIRDYPITLLRFFVYLYHSNIEFQSIAMQPDFLIGLTAAMYPFNEKNSKSSSKNLNPFSPESIDLIDNEECVNQEMGTRYIDVITLETINSIPARKLIMDFFKMIIVDNFALPTKIYSQHIIDIIFECDIENVNQEHMKQFQTVFINSLTEHCLAVDILSGQNLPLPTGGNYSNVPNNIYYFISRVVDKVWQEAYVDDPKTIMSFICRLIIQGKKRQVNLESLFRSLNRLVLFQLSRPPNDNRSRHSILKTLEQIFKTDGSNYGIIVFNQINNDSEFLVSLVQLLLQLYTGINIVGGSMWYSHDSIWADRNASSIQSNQKVNEDIRQYVESVWQEIIRNKKQILEDVFKMQLPPSLSMLPSNVEQICLKAWNTYLDSENAGTASSHWGKISFAVPSGGKDSSNNTSSVVSHSLQHQLSMKLNRMSRSGVLSKLSYSTSTGSNMGLSGSGNYPASIGASKTLVQISLDEAKLWIPPHIAVVKEMVEYNQNVSIKKESFMMHYVESIWKQVEVELTRERGIWGPVVGSPLDKWLLDSAEGPCRMRKKMIPNEFFYQHYPFREYHHLNADGIDIGHQMRKFKAASSTDSESYHLFSISRSILQEHNGKEKTKTVEICIEEVSKSITDENVTCPTNDPEESLRTTESLLRGRKPSVDILASGMKESNIEDKIDDDWNDSKLKSIDDENFLEMEETMKDSRADTVEDLETIHELDDSMDGKTKEVNQEMSSGETNVSQPSGAFLSNRDAMKKQSKTMPQWDNQAAIEHLIGADEKIHFMFRCARIQGLDVYEGLLLFGQSHFYIIDGFTLLKTREIVEIDNIPSEVHEPIVPSSPTNICHIHNQRRKMSEKFSFDEIREVHRRRYLLQPIAVEVFLSDGTNFLLAFPKKMQNKIYAKFMQVSPSLTLSAQQSISGQRQNSKIESGSSSIFSSLMGEKSVTQRWERGEISNFQYLMHLNTLAGRSYNDLMQYPVFPWILADYDSETLDLTNPATFRQLDKPMGAQSENRLKQFQKRYKEWDDPTGETPPYHYGTHYSSAMIVAFYLVRMEPFTQHFLKLQGGHFDLADRMFHSIKDTWESASQHNMADIKELIPEFFYLPNFLVNSNKFDLGSKQNGVFLNDILLPAWAKGDPREFIRAHREALECDFVSAHLNEWIDLIFGYKQHGEPAVDAVNVFHHLFYEGNVDIYSIDDPLKRSAVIGFINNFGQIPKQLFKKPHPSKKFVIPPSVMITSKQIDPMAPMASSAQAERLFYHNLDNLEPSMQPVKELKNAVGQVIQVDTSGAGTTVGGTMTSGIILAVEQNKCLIPPTYTRYVAWGFSDGSLRIGNYESDKLIKVYEMPDVYGDILCVLCPNERTIVTGGISTVVRVWSMNAGKLVSASSSSSSGSSARVPGGLGSILSLQENLYGHVEAVTCLAVAASYNILISGSRDRTCIMWDLGKLCYVRQLHGHAGPVAAICISEVSGVVASCAGTYLHLWSIDGEELASINTATGRSKQILTVTISTMMDWDPGNVIITGGTDGVVRMWSLEYVQVPVSSSTSSINRSSADLNRAPLTSFSQPCAESSSIADSSNMDEDDSDSNEAFEPPKFGVDVSQSATLTRSKSGTSVDIVPKTQYDIEEDYVVIGSVDLSNENTAKGESADNSSNATSEKPSRSFSQSIVHSAVLRSLSQSQLRSNMRKLKKGFQWQRQLIFRSKLTMHTAYERTDNANPSPVSAVTISKDHRSIYVGDHRGRVFCWSVPQEPGRNIADHWIRDENAEVCTNCKIKFSLTERRHHCRSCGFVFCNKCSKYEIEIHRLRLFKPVRVCLKCFTSLNSQQYIKATS